MAPHPKTGPAKNGVFWLGRLGIEALFVEHASPWENGYAESLFGKLRDELLNAEIFDTRSEARVIIEDWRREYNQHRPHSSLGYKPPAPGSECLKISLQTWYLDGGVG
jgi:putative transposase